MEEIAKMCSIQKYRSFREAAIYKYNIVGRKIMNGEKGNTSFELKYVFRAWQYSEELILRGIDLEEIIIRLRDEFIQLNSLMTMDGPDLELHFIVDGEIKDRLYSSQFKSTDNVREWMDERLAGRDNCGTK